MTATLTIEFTNHEFNTLIEILSWPEDESFKQPDDNPDLLFCIGRVNDALNIDVQVLTGAISDLCYILDCAVKNAPPASKNKWSALMAKVRSEVREYTRDEIFGWKPKKT